jgi:myo-inositol 2-dehydrogenase / D-chiro-inositol 1-dehydrogenase
MAARKLKIAIVGLGRMGKRHALHFSTLTPRADLVAAASLDAEELKWAERELPGIRTYLDYDTMLREETGIEAVIIASATTVHSEQAIKAIECGLHVLCEKPLSTRVDLSQAVVTAYERSLQSNPKQKVMCGFSRRFDASYRDAYNRVTAGFIGTPAVFRSQTCDQLDPSGFFVEYAQYSGGIFVDCSIHDIDLALWYFGEDTVVKSVTAVGVTAVSPELRKWNDRDNAVGVIEFHNGKLAQLFASRMMSAGQEDCSEITGTEGKLAVNCNPGKNMLSIHDKTGIRREIPADYYGRYREAFIQEAQEFTACCLDNTAVPVPLKGAVKAVAIGCALQESLISGKKIDFDIDGNRITSDRHRDGKLRARL